MITCLTFSAVWLIFALWQSTLCLGVSFLLAKWGVKTPWRAHVLLCTGIFAAVLADPFHNDRLSRRHDFTRRPG